MGYTFEYTPQHMKTITKNESLLFHNLEVLAKQVDTVGNVKNTTMFQRYTLEYYCKES